MSQTGWSSGATAIVLAVALWSGSPQLSAGEPNAAQQLSRARAGNRLAHLDAIDPYYPHRGFARLITPQWVGEEGVDAVVVLAIDDLREWARYEAYLRPIIDRLKQLDGRAPLSIMTNTLDPAEPHLQTWLAEGLNLDVHTTKHPCPLLAGGDLAAARATYGDCVDLLARVPNNRPVAFRMPCCDSLNTLSPRFFAEIFPRPTAQGHMLSIDSSVFNVLTSNDPALPRELVVEPDGTERFRRYLPSASYVNTIEDYPYPYVIGGACWEFPCVVPSDWSAQHVQQPNNPKTVSDWQAALDAVVVKQGVFNLVFHPHDWIRPEQVVELIDYAQTRYGRRVKFLNFREAAERLERNLLGGRSLRSPNSVVTVLDVDGDGLQDVVADDDRSRTTRLWNATSGRFDETTLTWPATLRPGPARFGVLGLGQEVVSVAAGAEGLVACRFVDGGWELEPDLTVGLAAAGHDLADHLDGLRLADIDGDGQCELLVASAALQAAFAWDAGEDRWHRLGWNWPSGAQFVGQRGRDAGLRVVDLNDDLALDLLWSNDEQFGVSLFDTPATGWAIQAMQGAPGDEGGLPRLVRQGTNNGGWFHSRHLWVQNEDTAREPDLVERRSFNELLAAVTARPLSPVASLAALKPRDGFVVDLVAAEPLVIDPVAFDWGPDGRFWVVEMHDYPQGIGKDRRPGGRVRCLRDDDGDGHYDRSSVFLDGLRFPTSVAAWGNGVLVTSAPEILYAEDTDGDDVADRREALFTGFSKGNPQHQMNGLQRGLDGWFYCANGHSEGKVRSALTGDVVDVSNRDFRIHPATGRLETEIGATQFIRSRDDWGHWFGNNNIDPLWHFVLEERYLRRNPHVAYPDPRASVPEMPGSAPVFARSRTVARFNDLHTADHFTSACSTIIYRDELLGPTWAGNSFVSEPVHNLVHREPMRSVGLSFVSRRAADEVRSEFLASTDTFFRPAMVQTGPDGAIWVADMYRLVIEHPEWIPPAVLRTIDVRAGDDRGRIYRVYQVGAAPRAIPNLSQLGAVELVTALDSPNGWQRDMAAQLLIEREDRAAVPALVQLATQAKLPVARLHALAVLAELDALHENLLVAALRHEHPGLRRYALRLSEPWLAGEGDRRMSPELIAAILACGDDADQKVCLQLACTLGAWADPAAGRALARLAMRASDEPLMLAAIASSATGCLGDLIEALAVEAKTAPPPASLVSDLLATATALERGDVLGKLLAVIVQRSDQGYGPWQLSALNGLLDALARRQVSLADFVAQQAAALPELADDLQRAFDYAGELVANGEAGLDDRLVATELLGNVLSSDPQTVAALVALLAPQQPALLQTAAVEALSRASGSEVPAQLFAAWRGYSPTVRGAILDVMLRRGEWVDACLDALESGKLQPAELDALRRQRLLEHSRAEVRERSAKLLAAATASRAAVLAEYQAALDVAGHSEAGREVFRQRCAVCHKFDGAGHAVGPDLSALVNKSPEVMLQAILDPNAALESRYTNYTAVTTDGLTFTGLLASETDNSVTLLGQEGQQHTLLRGDLETLESAGKSLMPEGLERDISPQAMADLLAYLGTVVPVPKSFAGNRPAPVQVDALRGELFCLASNAEIYGQTLVFEPTNNNLGYWGGDDDRAVWTLDVRRAARYAVMLEWAAPDDVAGNEFVLEVAGQRLVGRVESTGSWNDYHRETIGEVRLEPGTVRLGIRSNGPVAGYLFDLKSITLRPIGR